jgi:uncharacterized membrane protein YeaQ/YmgE (transglycosylase-associated protein family)
MTGRTEANMQLLQLLLIGTGAGWLADRLMRRRHSLAGELTVGVVGSFVGNFTFGLLGLSAYGLIGAFTTALVGAMLFLTLIRYL